MKKFQLLLLFVLIFSFSVTLRAEMQLNGVFDWKKSKKVCRGIIYSRFELKKPRLMKVSAVRIDFKEANCCFKITPRDPDWGKPMPDFPEGIIRTKRITCRKFMENAVKNGENMVVSINGSPWSPFRAPWTFRYAGNQGLMIADGVLVAPIRKGRPSFVVYKNGDMEFRLFQEGDDISKIAHAISGFGFVLRDGALTPKNNPKAKLAPRTGYGLSKDKRYMYLVVIDGRQERYSMGASTYEVGQWLKFLGAYSGLNMDGGGSTTLFVRRKNKMIKLNSHAFGAERAVGGAMGIVIRK